MKTLISAAALLVLCSCVDTGHWRYHADGNYGPAWWDDKAHAKYSHVSDSAPESLKPFYDPDLTKKLNQ